MQILYSQYLICSFMVFISCFCPKKGSLRVAFTANVMKAYNKTIKICQRRTQLSKQYPISTMPPNSPVYYKLINVVYQIKLSRTQNVLSIANFSFTLCSLWDQYYFYFQNSQLTFAINKQIAKTLRKLLKTYI